MIRFADDDVAAEVIDDDEQRRRTNDGPVPRRATRSRSACFEEIIGGPTGKAELRENVGSVREGKGLVEFCKVQPRRGLRAPQKLDLDKLVEQLEAAGGEQGRRPEQSPALR